MLYFIYILFLVLVVFFSYGFVDTNFPYTFFSDYHSYFFTHRYSMTGLYVLVVSVFFVFYLYFLNIIKKNRLRKDAVWRLVGITVGILLFAYPAFSHDIFNYIATANVAFLYQENPYIIMPIEIPNEPLLSFMHAANKIALYGPMWIILTGIPHVIGLSHLLLTILSFKLFVAGFYLGLCWLLWKITKKNLYAVSLFALNPLVVIETLISGHNDVVMMFFALLAFYLLQRKRIFLAVVVLLCSVLIKYATVFLIPVFVYYLIKTLRRRVIVWDTVYYFAFFSMFVVFLLSPLREEMYPWYAIWFLVFLPMLIRRRYIVFFTVALSAGLLLRYIPFMYLGTHFGITPLLRIVLTLLPVACVAVWVYIRKEYTLR